MRSRDMAKSPPEGFIGIPPYVKDSDTSRDAAGHMMEKAKTLREKVEAAIYMGGKRGRTSEQVEEFLRMKHQTVSARIWELKRDGKVFDSGHRRTNNSGTKAALMVHKKYASEHPPCPECGGRGTLCTCIPHSDA